MRVHVFNSSGQAYNASQCSEEIKDGDVLVVKTLRLVDGQDEEQCVAILYKAWPVLVHGKCRARCFHLLEEGSTWLDLEDGDKYLPSVELANSIRFDSQPSF